MYSITNKNPKHRISNGYSRKKHTRQFDEYNIVSYASTLSKNTPQVELIQFQDENFIRLKKKVELSLPGNKTFKLYSRISQNIASLILDGSILRKIRQVQCQLLKLLLLSSFPDTRQDKAQQQQRRLMTPLISKQNSLSCRPQTFQTTSNIKRRRLFHQSVGQSAKSTFQRFKMSESIKRLQTQLQKVPQLQFCSLKNSIRQVKQVNKSQQQQVIPRQSQIHVLSQQIKVKDLRIHHLVSQISLLNVQNSKLKFDLNQSTQSIAQLSFKLQYYKNNLQFQQLWRMSNEEITILKINKSEIERELRHLNRKYKINKDRLNELMKNRSSGIVDQAKQDMEDIKFLIAQLNVGSRNIHSKQISIESIKYKLPNILILFDTDKIKETGNNVKLIGAEFFLKLRGILDSKYNQFWGNPQPKNSMGLSDFTIGFLDKFAIDTKYKKIMANGSNAQQTERNKQQFIFNLSSSKLKDVIQISLFKEFLFQQRARDQLFFFLSCRHVLFNGHILDNVISSQDPIVFVPLDRACKIIDQILINFDKILTDRIKQSLNLKRKKKAHKFFVDGHFVLKALLQLYSLQRKKKLCIFKKCLVNEDNFQKPIVFKTLKKFLNKNYPFVTNAEISQIYRNCWKLTEGQMQIELLFNMCDWIFIQQLKDQIFLPKRFHNEYKQHLNRVEEHLQQGKYFTRRALELGNQKTLLQVNKLKNLLTNLKSKDLLNMQQLFSLITLMQIPKNLKVIQMLSISASYKLSNMPYLVQDDFRISQFEQLTKINIKNQQSRRKQKQAAEKIGIYFDGRIQRLYKRFGADINKQLVDLSIVIP